MRRWLLTVGLVLMLTGCGEMSDERRERLQESIRGSGQLFQKALERPPPAPSYTCRPSGGGAMRCAPGP